MERFLSERFILGLTGIFALVSVIIDYVDYEYPTDSRSPPSPALPPGPTLPLRYPVGDLSHLRSARLPLPSGAQARSASLRELSRTQRHHRLLRAAGPGRAHAPGRGRLAGTAGRAAGIGGTEPAAPLGAEGGLGPEEEPWFVVSTRNAASLK